jgi:hypothetical protein
MVKSDSSRTIYTAMAFYLLIDLGDRDCPVFLPECPSVMTSKFGLPELSYKRLT